MDGDIINQTEQARNSRLREEVDEFTFGYFEFGTFMSPRFLFLDFRNLKTKWLGFGMESSIFSQILFHCSYNKKELVAVESYMKMARENIRSLCACDQQSLKITSTEGY